MASVIQRSSLDYHNKSDDYGNDNKYRQKQKNIRKVQEESVEAIKTINFSPEFISMTNWSPSLSQQKRSI